MNTIKAIFSRRSIRKYQDKPIEKSVIDEIIGAGIMAPSGKNRQPWRYMVIQNDKALKNGIADIMIEKLDKNPDMDPGSIRNSAEIIKQAPVFIVAFNTWHGKIPNSNLQSIGASIQNICLAAWEHEIGTCWICDIDHCFDEIKEFLKVPDDWYPVAGITMGAPAINPSVMSRLTLNDIAKFK